jgi:hypothetical protein
MNYKAGDTVRIRSREWMNAQEKDHDMFQSPEEKNEFMDLITGFLDKKDPRGFFHVTNIREKRITEKDLEEQNEQQ